MKITLIQKREWQNNGYQGFGYAGFKEGGGVIQFTSSIEHDFFPGETAFNSKKCEEISLNAKIWDEKVKYVEDGSAFE